MSVKLFKISVGVCKGAEGLEVGPLAGWKMVDRPCYSGRCGLHVEIGCSAAEYERVI